MTQPTDEAAVIMLSGICGYHHKADCDSCKNARECTDAEIERLRAQLTAATAESRRFKALADDHFRNAQQNAERHTAATRRAEQAEKMLAEAVPYMVHSQSCASQSYDAANKHRRGACDCKYNEFLAAIRSAASGEQG